MGSYSISNVQDSRTEKMCRDWASSHLYLSNVKHNISNSGTVLKVILNYHEKRGEKKNLTADMLH